MTKRQILKICDNTIKHFKNILKKSDSKYISIGVKGGGCNGMRYYVEPSNDPPQKLDEQIIIDNVKINVCGSSLLYILGTEIKWNEDYMGKGLQFINPNATGKCGCGETFSV